MKNSSESVARLEHQRDVVRRMLDWFAKYMPEEKSELRIRHEAWASLGTLFLGPKQHGCRGSLFPPFENRERWGTRI